MKSCFSILFLVTITGLWAQPIISNVATLHSRPGQQGGVYNEIAYSESPNFNYIGCKTLPDDVYFDDVLLLSDEGKDLEISGSKYLVVQIDKTNQYVNHVELKIETPPPLSTGTNLAAYHSIGIYSDESGLYLYGTVVKTDSLFLNEKLLRSVNKSMGFILQFDESLNLVDEFYFQEKNPNIEVWLKEIYIKDNRLVLFGSFLGRGEAFIQPMDIANESIFPILIGGENLTEFVIALDRKSKKIARHIPFIQASVGFFSLNDIDEDDDGNIYVATKNNGGKFIVAGKTVPINRHFDYGAVSFSIDTLDKLNFITNYEGYGVENVTMIKGACDESVYEVGYMAYFAPIMHEIYMYMNYDSIRVFAMNSEFILKRDKSGSLQWIKYSGCNTGYDYWLTMDCSYNDHIVMGGYSQCSKSYNQMGMIRYLDKNTGATLNEYLLVKDTFVTQFEVNAVKYQLDGSLKVIAHLGAIEKIKGPVYFELAGQRVEVPIDGSLCIFDFKPSLQKTEEKDNRGVIIYPNPVCVGETLRIDVENVGMDKYIIQDIMGRVLKEIKGSETVVDLDSGMYFLTTSDRKIIGKIVVVR